jgi:hypothetical protein
MATNGYCTRSEFKLWAGTGDTIDDVTIDRAIDAVSRGIDNFTKTQFWMTGGTRVFDSCDGRELDIDDAVMVTQVVTDTDSDGVFETVWATSDYQLLPLNPTAAPERKPFTKIRAVGDLRFPRPTSTGRIGLSQVLGQWGSPAIPAPVHQMALILVHRTVRRRGSPEGVAGGFDEFGAVRISREDPDAVRYLMPYKTSRRRGGWAFA